ncbi:class II aldolase/adducin family protein [Sphingomonas crocodyli]|uniref:Class II aldolase/adducin family protein n=1 Tax=Sphingomonas crocodyli TaxID=1979270 RepID=A0A437M5X5_9SPHN|nr:class II aldolase/adducin family protein [Sphingomonas crocodyli]RVT93047.1 class II aldolase/adducin family protein [Sphingomonas crocodyli]
MEKSPVTPIHRTSDHAMSEVEWRTRVDLAAFYRLVDHFGWTDLIYNHLSARIPDATNTYLVNRYGLMFEEITASNLITVDAESGAVLPRPGSAGAERNEAVHVLHGSVLRSRPDLMCLAHVHTPAIMAVSAMEGGLFPITQTAMGLMGLLGYHDYGFDDAACDRLVHDFATADIVILRNHGVLIGGTTIAEAFVHLHNFEFACKAQVAAVANRDGCIVPPKSVLEQHVAVVDRWMERAGGPRDGRECIEWQACLRMLERRGIDYAI